MSAVRWRISHTCRELAWRRGFEAHRLTNQPFGVRWEDDLAAILSGPPTLAFDVGANEGQTARRLLARFPGLRVCSFEPNPEALAQLQALAARHPSMEAVGAAASDQDGGIELVLAECSRHSSVVRAPRPGERTATVPALRLDTFCEERGVTHLSLLKVDAEGHELAVLQGAERLLERGQIDALLLECGFEESPGQPHGDFFRLHPFLLAHGYALVAFYVSGVDGNGWRWGDVLYRLRSDDPMRTSPFT